MAEKWRPLPPSPPLNAVVLRGLWAMSHGRDVLVRWPGGKAKGPIAELHNDVPVPLEAVRDGSGSTVRFIMATGESVAANDIVEITLA